MTLTELLSELKYYIDPIFRTCEEHLLKLKAENENLRAYAVHERSLGAEGPMLDLHDLKQKYNQLESAATLARDALNRVSGKGRMCESALKALNGVLK